MSYRTKKLAPAEEREWTVIEGAHEAIVSDELFAIVHDRFARHTRVSQNRQTEHLLSGYVKCTRCGGRMNRNVSHGVARFRCMTPDLRPGAMPVPVHSGCGAGGSQAEPAGELHRKEIPVRHETRGVGETAAGGSEVPAVR